jgi:hypothetical protein
MRLYPGSKVSPGGTQYVVRNTAMGAIRGSPWGPLLDRGGVGGKSVAVGIFYLMTPTTDAFSENPGLNLGLGPAWDARQVRWEPRGCVFRVGRNVGGPRIAGMNP